MAQVFATALTILLLVSGSCSTAPVPQKGHWSIKLTTSGGFAGVGTGNLNADSQGKFHYEEPAPRSSRKGCDGELRPNQLQLIAEAVEQSNPKEWNRSDLNIAAPDAFGYKLELRMESESEPIIVQWYDNTKDKLPADLKHLSDVLMQTMKAACRPAPADER